MEPATHITHFSILSIGEELPDVGHRIIPCHVRDKAADGAWMGSVDYTSPRLRICYCPDWLVPLVQSLRAPFLLVGVSDINVGVALWRCARLE